MEAGSFDATGVPSAIYDGVVIIQERNRQNKTSMILKISNNQEND
jgi:hypothetical protein